MCNNNADAEIINFSHSGATIEGDESSTEGSNGGGIEDAVENFDAAMRGKDNEIFFQYPSIQ